MGLRTDILELYRDMYRLTVRVRFYPYALLTQDLFDEFDRELFRIQGRWKEIKNRVDTSSERLYTYTEAELKDERFWFLVWVKDRKVHYGFRFTSTPLINLNLMEAVDFLKLVIDGIKLAIRIKYARWKAEVEHELVVGMRDKEKNLFIFKVRENWKGIVNVETPSAWGNYANKDYRKGAKFRAILFVRTVARILPYEINWTWRPYTDVEKKRILKKRKGVPLKRWRTMEFDHLNTVSIRHIKTVGNRSVWRVDFKGVMDKGGNVMVLPSILDLKAMAKKITTYGATAKIREVAI